jgi:hypothetical protein
LFGTALLLSSSIFLHTASAADGPVVLPIKSGAAEAVYVSGRMINEITPPFKNTKWITECKECVKKDDGKLYVSMNGNKFIQLILKDADKVYEETFSVTLITEKAMAGQHIVLKADIDMRSSSVSQEYKSNDYIDFLRELMRDVALDKLPRSFVTEQNPDKLLPTFQVGPVKLVNFQNKIGGSLIVEYFSLVNESDVTIDLQQRNFYQDGVKSISFRPNKVLSPGEKTVMYRVVEKKRQAR